MDSNSLFMICFSAFVAVFILLFILSFLMRGIMMIFPQKEVDTDVAVYAAVVSAVSRIYPGKKITNIEEIK